MNPLRSVMRKIEAEVLGDCGIRFEWSNARLRVKSTPTTYRMFIKQCRLAGKEGAPCWHALSLWKNEEEFLPTEEAIDAALRNYNKVEDTRGDETPE